ncbi:LysE/ArgO family amino acid transporter [Tropicibacter naphthalenivorans]|uniref:Arginine exporter protein ArgO n=1 Tax=Tropicibacter naphthalenivorans TaxID=441103 RepID=A0A0P1G3G3_9RHOB|nr:LysE/ArgO family amino acid transporter [Tropicibacter naphthalenivorans]CUH76184.1 Arginine exporter protein ArgO [Tropicibacter naphthalenivorans]SMC39479.1 L-lysine exporter family protein LysE/ArgO [Tropicibacter naphthalenivorans]
MDAALAGFALSLGLIVAIGAQNAFVLRQGLRRAHVLPVVLVCALSDAVLIAAGVAGFGALTRLVPGLEWGMRLFGAAFLIWYGARTLLSAWRGGEALTAGGETGTWQSAVLTCLALTWLNPHVYLDTVVMLGAISAGYDDRLAFAIGAMSASGVFFVTLGYGARALAPVFARPAAWRILDLLIGLTMFAIALSLLKGG